MTKTKAFFTGFLLTLGIIVPFYGVIIGLRFFAPTEPVEAPKTNIPIAVPAEQDVKTLCLIVENGEGLSFYLVKLDALNSNISAIVLDENTFVHAGTSYRTLTSALDYAGPAYVKNCLQETLGITIDNYLLTNAETLAKVYANFKTSAITVQNAYSGYNTSGYKVFDAKKGDNIMTFETALAAIRYSGYEQAALTDFKAHIMRQYLGANLNEIYAQTNALLRDSSSSITTNITATQIYEYEKVLKFLTQLNTKIDVVVLPGDYANGYFELGEKSLATVRTYIGIAQSE